MSFFQGGTIRIGDFFIDLGEKFIPRHAARIDIVFYRQPVDFRIVFLDAMEFFDGRKAEIVNGLERAKRAQDEAKERMAELENRLGRLSAEIAAMKTQVDQEAASEKSRIVAEAQREVDRIVEQSRQEMERIAHGVQREIKESVADVVIDRASQKLQTKMTADDQKRVVGRFIKNL